MKSLIFRFILLFCFCFQYISQLHSQAAIVSVASSPDWRAGGNLGAFGVTPNVIGTFWNSPFFQYTNGTARAKFNAMYFPFNPQYPINGFVGGAAINDINTSGYLLVGSDNPTASGNPSLFNSKGAFSLLHLNGLQISPGGFTCLRHRLVRKIFSSNSSDYS